ncbi:Transcription factor gsfR2 [Fusarium oxysporum f. sp. cubense]|uniref:Transcription factor gsfR2 n=1 Tax=Fusarium oxysporum f. sp. cubense TaxID=61366 RepID=A0A559KQE3_FUSOC|nr:Transcription factor gsfR2 [Fusarium oxysporum f. sp. cubense]
MSLTARERRNPPSRRKSCTACTKAKRRCDFALPACLRCSQRQISCQYPTRTIRGQLTPQSESPETVSPCLLSNEPSPEVSGSFPISGSIIEDFNAIISRIDASSNGLDTFDLPLEDVALELAQQPLTLTGPSTQDFGNVSAHILNRLQWAVDEIKEAPKKMVLENQTPWCHPLLYKDAMPRSMQDAHSSCALYMAKNRINSPIIFRSIESRVNDLLSAPPPITPLDCLAHTQALILYQIIRLYDGDIGARTSAERIIPAIEASAMSLFSYAQFDIEGTPGTLPLYPIAPTKAFWQDWILQESLRRTLLFSFYLVQTYRIMSGCKMLQCDGRLGLCHSWTLSAYLWNAMTPLGFAEAWRDKDHYVVTNAIFNGVLAEAEADDIDVFGKIMISSLLGRDEAEGWFASKGGKL